jgi:hypothetical protein
VSISPLLCRSNNKALGIGSSTTPSFCLSLVHFLTTFHIYLDTSHPTIPHLSQCQCGHTINDLGIHLLCCLCESEHTTTHDTFRNIVVIIASHNGVHVKKKVSHFFLALHKDKWILSLPDISFEPWQILSLLI